MQHRNRAPTLLVVDDSPEDFEMIRRGLAAIDLETGLQHCQDGDEALEYLRRDGRFAAAPRPDLVLLDLNLPGTDGRDVLREMRKDPQLRWIPTIVFSNSGNINDVNACYALGANSFIAKPLGPRAFVRVMAGLRDYWLSLVRLPDSYHNG